MASCCSRHLPLDFLVGLEEAHQGLVGLDAGDLLQIGRAQRVMFGLVVTGRVRAGAAGRRQRGQPAEAIVRGPGLVDHHRAAGVGNGFVRRGELPRMRRQPVEDRHQDEQIEQQHNHQHRPAQGLAVQVGELLPGTRRGA